MSEQLIDEDRQREKAVYRVTMFGGAMNTILLLFKFTAGIIGHSSAMVADAVHSLSDFVTDILVLLFVKISNRPADKDHAYGHGKFETLATLIIAVALISVGGMLMADGVSKIMQVIHGEILPKPGWIAFAAAIVSVVLKEVTYQVSARVGRQYHSDAVVANAWHHRSDAFSSIGTGLGIGGAIVLGNRWTVLDPIAGCIVSVVIIVIAIKLGFKATSDLMEHSLGEEVEKQIYDIVAQDTSVSELHHLRTRSVGNHYAIEMHLRMPGNTSLYEAHQHSMLIEQKLKQQFGTRTHIGIHIEPTKRNGEYCEPDKCPC